MLEIALFQPDIPQNMGTIMRFCACMGTRLHIIEPCGFPLDDAKIRRAGMDYIDQLDYVRYSSWAVFLESLPAEKRLILMTTKASDDYTQTAYGENDILIAGSESSGAPEHVHDRADLRVKINMTGDSRSLNIAIATAMIAGEAIRQIQKKEIKSLKNLDKYQGFTR